MCCCLGKWKFCIPVFCFWVSEIHMKNWTECNSIQMQKFVFDVIQLPSSEICTETDSHTCMFIHVLDISSLRYFSLKVSRLNVWTLPTEKCHSVKAVLDSSFTHGGHYLMLHSVTAEYVCELTLILTAENCCTISLAPFISKRPLV